jgi:hypothetical protein
MKEETTKGKPLETTMLVVHMSWVKLIGELFGMSGLKEGAAGAIGE